MNILESALLRLGGVEQAVAGVGWMAAAMDGLSAELGALSARHVALEERCSRLEDISSSCLGALARWLSVDSLLASSGLKMSDGIMSSLCLDCLMFNRRTRLAPYLGLPPTLEWS